MNGGINDYGVNQFLARRLNITDTLAPASTLAPEVMPVLDVLPPSQEDAYLRGERLCGAGYSVSASVGNYSVATLLNPANSGILVMLDQITNNAVTPSGYLDHYIERVNLPTLGAVNGSVLDTRWPLTTAGARRHQAIFAIGNTPTAPNINWAPFFETRYATGQPNVYPVRAVIAPGSMYICYTTGLNVDLALHLFWRERPSQPSERT